MKARQYLNGLLKSLIAEMELEWPEKAVIEPSRGKEFGDYAANIALLLAKQKGMSPREFAGQLVEGMKKKAQEDGFIQHVEVAGPGFLNVTFSPGFWQSCVTAVEGQRASYGSSNAGQGRKVQVEFVSANPTGPLHIGHGRGAAIGDTTARVLRMAGYDVTAEYYINDAGRQMRLLGLSVWLRARELAGKNPQFPEDYYRGEYIIDIARRLMEKQPDLLNFPDEQAEDICFEFAMNDIMDGIKQDLRDFRVHHDVWFSERSLVESGAVERALEQLKLSGRTYEQDGALWFATTPLGDDKDRVLRKSDGSLTYFASDIAYHADKFERGFAWCVDVWGADHHGYVPRMRAAIRALGKSDESFAVILVQLVNLMQDGELIAMSTRAGQFETLADVVKEVGADAARFMFLYRKNDSPLDFDLALVKQRNMDNPVYYVQYAHARVASLLRKGAERDLTIPVHSEAAHLELLVLPEELDLMRTVDAFGDTVAEAAHHLAPHQISFYLMELAGLVHRYYAGTPVLNADSPELAKGRLALLRAAGQVLANGLDLLGVSAPDTM